jgi:hypothetical protein
MKLRGFAGSNAPASTSTTSASEMAKAAIIEGGKDSSPSWARWMEPTSTLVDAELVIPYASQGRISEVYENTTVLSEAFDESGRKLRVRDLPGAIARLTQAFGA